MAMPTYFLTPNFEYSPDSISLGHIISAPSDPSYPLNLGQVEPIPEKKQYLNRVCHYTFERSERRPKDIFSKFWEMMRIGNSVDIKSEVFEFDELDTVSFEPSPDYLQKAVQASGVQQFLRANRFRKPVYIITSMKIARGARLSRSAQSKLDVTAGGGVSEGVGPAGVSLDYHRDRAEDFANKLPSDFVFAIRLRKLKVRQTFMSAIRDNATESAVDISVEDTVVGDVRNAVAEETADEDPKESASVVLYSAEAYHKGATL